MKKLLAILITFFFSTMAYSQWGIIGGMNYSTLTGTEMSTGKVYGHIGGTYEFKLSKKWYLQPQLLFTAIGHKLIPDDVLRKGYADIYALEMPINFSFRPQIAKNTHLLIEAGIYGRLGLWGERKYSYYHRETQTDDIFSLVERYEIGLNAGAGVQVKQCFGIASIERGRYMGELLVYKVSLGYKF